MRLTRRVADALRSPARLVAFARRVLHLVRRGELPALMRRFRPRSASPARYRAWRALQPAPAPCPAAPFVLALDACDDAARAAMLTASAAVGGQAAAVLVRTAAGGWSRADDDEHRPLAAWLEATGARWIWWLEQAARFEPGTSHAIAAACKMPQARVIYADHDLADADGRPSAPCLKSAWDAEQIIERAYAGPLLVVHATLAADVDAARGTGGAWAFLLRCAERLEDAAFVHVPRVLVHLAHGADDNRALRAAVAPALRSHLLHKGAPADLAPDRAPWVRHAVAADVTLSVVVPTRDRSDLLERCLRSVLAGAPAATEIVVVDNGSTDPALAPLVEVLGRQRPVRIVRVDEPFNFSRLCNAGAEAASGRVIVLLNNDTVLHEGALVELAALAARPGTGAVGPLLLYPDGRIQSAGVLVGVNRTATSALQGFAPEDPAALHWCAARRRVSAVMGACLAVERTKYRAVQGMDEALAVSHNEVDLCLKLEAAGWSNVFSPFARVTHEEGASRGFEVTPSERARLAVEEARFCARWAHVLDGVDPAHHPSLARRGNPFALGPPGAPDARSGWRVHTPRPPCA